MIYIHVPFCRSFCTYCDFYSEILHSRKAECGRGLFLEEGPRPADCDHSGLQSDIAGQDNGHKKRPCPIEGQPRPEMGAVERYADEICREIRKRQEEIRATLGLNTLYIGGGTPSVLPLPVLRRIVEALSEVTGVPVGRYEEFTIEVNPEDIVERGPEFVLGLLELGVTRISMGVQSRDDGILRWMNRRHDAARARQAWQILREAAEAFPPSQISGREEQKGAKTFPPSAFSGRREHSPACSLSVDLIIGVPGMTEGIISETLKELVSWRPDHISAYQLSIEEGSTLAERIAAGKEKELPEEKCRAQYEMVCRALAAAGYEHYEISNWALPGRRSLHNSAYWTRRPYVGLGPGAHSLEIRTAVPCLGGAGVHLPEGGMQRRSWNSKALSGWTREGEVLGPEEIREERIMLGLRTADGIEPELLAKEAQAGSVQRSVVGDQGGSVQRPVAGAEGAKGDSVRQPVAEAEGRLPAGLEWNGGRIRIAENDWFVADEIIANLI